MSILSLTFCSWVAPSIRCLLLSKSVAGGGGCACPLTLLPDEAALPRDLHSHKQTLNKHGYPLPGPNLSIGSKLT